MSQQSASSLSTEITVSEPHRLAILQSRRNLTQILSRTPAFSSFCESFERTLPARASDKRPADEIERANSALEALAVQVFSSGNATFAYIYTTDIATGEGTESLLASKGYDDAVTFVNGFRSIDDLLPKG